MQVRFFVVPLYGGDAAAEELNCFLAGQRILRVDSQLAQDEKAPVWAVCVTYGSDDASVQEPGTPVNAGHETLSRKADFLAYEKLCSLRSKIGRRGGIPGAAILTNDQLADMVIRDVRSLDDLTDIPGIDRPWAERHGEAFVEALQTARADAVDYGYTT